ncbi:hypothetical protein EVAR_24631_1 [Eumeta japonica]|uniref:Uncharacterized protein n=1 Tax=Eumeta variegata TaxID=151549 RepID=A0A4C1V2F4_EUMVA|nr:hypothetical protein EVAR_24631_1 [Eumeta japonica]
MCQTLMTVLKRTTARPWKLRATRLNAASHVSPRHSISRAPLRCQDATSRRGIRQLCNEAKRRRGYLNYNARMRLKMRPALAAGPKTIENNRSN